MKYVAAKHQYIMKTLFTLLVLTFSLQINAQTYSTLDRQTAKFDTNGKLQQVCNYYSFPSNVYYSYSYEYNTDGRLLSVAQHTYQGFGKPWYKRPDSTDTNFKFTYQYNSDGYIIEERYYNNYRVLTTRCTYDYKGDSALTITKYMGWGKTVESKIVFKLHKIAADKKTAREASQYVELYEKTYYDSLNKVIRKIKYTYGMPRTQTAGINAHYGQYSAIYLNSVSAFNSKGKLLQERKRMRVNVNEYYEDLDSTVIYVPSDDYDIKYEDTYYTRNGNVYGFDEDKNPRVLDYLNCRFDDRNTVISTGMWWDQDEFISENFDDMMEFSVIDLNPNYVEVKD